MLNGFPNPKIHQRSGCSIKFIENAEIFRQVRNGSKRACHQLIWCAWDACRRRCMDDVSNSVSQSFFGHVLSFSHHRRPCIQHPFQLRDRSLHSARASASHRMGPVWSGRSRWTGKFQILCSLSEAQASCCSSLPHLQNLCNGNGSSLSLCTWAFSLHSASFFHSQTFLLRLDVSIWCGHDH